MDQVSNTLWSLDTDHLDAGAVDELLRQTELRQAAMFTASVGMDQRAAVLGAGLLAASGALAAAGVAITGGDAGALRHGAFAAAAMLAIGALFCIYACRPQIARFPGIQPMEWGYDPNYLKHGIVTLKLARAAKIQDEMTENEIKQKANGRAIMAGLWIGVAAPLVGAIVALS